MFLVTGAGGGIGEAIATDLASTGTYVLIGARTVASGTATAARIRARYPAGELGVVDGDLAEMSQVRAVAAQVRAHTDHLDGLILNAAQIRPRRELTSDGFETMFATNYLAGFLLTALLRPMLAAAPGPARVITTSSAVHTRVKTVDLPALASGSDFAPSRTYETTKLLAVLFAAELAHRTNLTAASANPGFVHTDLGRHATGALRVLLGLTRPFQITPRQGAATAVHLATIPHTEIRNGGYYTQSRPRKPSKLARNQDLADELWSRSVALLTNAQSATADELEF